MNSIISNSGSGNSAVSAGASGDVSSSHRGDSIGSVSDSRVTRVRRGGGGSSSSSSSSSSGSSIGSASGVIGAGGGGGGAVLVPPAVLSTPRKTAYPEAQQGESTLTKIFKHEVRGLIG